MPQVSGVAWADSPRLCALTLGAPAVLVLELGAREAEVCAGAPHTHTQTHTKTHTHTNTHKHLTIHQMIAGIGHSSQERCGRGVEITILYLKNIKYNTYITLVFPKGVGEAHERLHTKQCYFMPRIHLSL